MIVDTQELVRRLRSLDVEQIAVHLPAGAERDAVEAACRETGKEIAGLEASPDVVVTADAVVADGLVRPLKEEVDAALPDARTVIVIRLAGGVPLAPTLDAYLDVEMVPGRDVWLEDLGADEFQVPRRSTVQA